MMRRSDRNRIYSLRLRSGKVSTEKYLPQSVDWMYYRNFWKTIPLQRLWSTERRIFFWKGAADWNGAVSILKIRRG